MDITFSAVATFVLCVGGVGLLLYATLFTVPQRSLALVQRLGKFVRVSEPGLHARVPFIERVAGRVNLRVQQIDLRLESKTEDDVFVNVTLSVQFYVLPDRAYDAFYRLQNVQKHITSLVFDVVRARVPSLTLDVLLARKADVAVALARDLSVAMDEFGYGVARVLVTEVEPGAQVKDAMNERHIALHMRLAAVERGEAERITRVKAAEGDAQSKALLGRGIAEQRQVIFAGLSASVDELRKGLPGMSTRDVASVVLMTQYLEMLAQIGGTSHSNTIMIPHMPSAVLALTEQIRVALTETGLERAPEEGAGKTLRYLRTRHDDAPGAVPGNGHGELGKTYPRTERRRQP